MDTRTKFAMLAEQWAEHCSQVRFSSNTRDYLNHPAFHEIIKLGWPAIPWIMDRYHQDNLFWGFVLQEITGVQIIKNKNWFSPPEVKQEWFDWWSKQRENFLPTGVSEDVVAPTRID